MSLFHGGRARVKPGGLIKPGHKANSWGDRPGQPWTHVFAAADMMTAADYAKATRGRLYEVEPTGELQPDTHEGEFKATDPLVVIRRVPAGEWEREAGL
jgi:Rifampin ADP-ribosyl transferase